MKNFLTIEDYIANFEKETQIILTKIRNLVLKNVPQVEESISYGMPTYKTFKKPLLYFAAYKNHIGFYATPNAHKVFVKELANYKQGKGSVQFPINEKIPYDLIKKIIEFRVVENNTKYNKK
ncbi:MAG: DUF1801 domain-containing protein [Ferruginibacter sp.]|nr:DUF1801 domain-containing protein [Ferruginibacter sp.]